MCGELRAVLIVVFSYNRPKALLRTLKEWAHAQVVVIDDGSGYDPSPHLEYCQYYRLKHLGKPFFWDSWNYALSLCKRSEDETFLFIPDDWCNYDVDEIERLSEHFKGLYAFNIANFGRESCWTSVKHEPVDVDGYACLRNSFVDCAFMTNRETLDKLDWSLHWVNPLRFRDPYISSGVGEQLSRRFFKKFVPMYKPLSSLCGMQDVPSEMNKLERERTPLAMI